MKYESLDEAIVDINEHLKKIEPVRKKRKPKRDKEIERHAKHQIEIESLLDK